MGAYLGFDTSNYTTSVAVYHSDSGEMLMEKRLLPTKEGALGLRQSEAVFSHIKQLGELAKALMERSDEPILAVGASVFPRRLEGSYMPCFLVGQTVGETVAAAMHLPFYSFSHQEGHVAAALYSAGKTDWVGERFLAFHLSGGTTDALLVSPGEPCFTIEQAASSLDLKAGQVVDRVGLMLGCKFPCGPELTELALCCNEKIKVRPVMKGADCCLSGIENQCKKLLGEGKSKEYIALFALRSVEAALIAMTAALQERYGKLPLLYAGGVMSNVIIRKTMEEKFGGVFAEPKFSADNAGGIAFLTALSHEKEQK